MIRATFALMLVWPGLATASAALEIPFLSGRIVDLADLIDPATEQRIEARLARMEATQGHQVAVLTLPSLEGESLEDFSIRVVETWRLGREGIDDGALLLIARDDRLMRIEVGYGLEATLTDLRTNRIQTEILRPSFRGGDFAGGIESAVDALAGVLEGTDLPSPRATGPSGNLGATERLGMFAFVAFIIGMFSFNALFASGASGCFFYLFLAPFWGLFPAALMAPEAGAIALGIWLIGFPIAWWIIQKTAMGERWRSRRAKRTRDVWSSDGGWRRGGRGGFGGFGGGGFGGGGFGGGGFSGGGGSFGGGGSSSSW